MGAGRGCGPDAFTEWTTVNDNGTDAKILRVEKFYDRANVFPDSCDRWGSARADEPVDGMPYKSRSQLADGWSRHHDKCVNCKADKYPHKARGYCVQCYPIAQRVKVLEAWAPGQPVPREMHSENYRGGEFLSKLRRAWVREYERRLAQLRWFEEEPDHISGLDIEYLMNSVARYMRPRVRSSRSPHYGIASWINSQFGAAERRALRKLLIDMLRDLRWKPSYSAIYRGAYDDSDGERL
jgi:hypothetical protein